MNLDSVKYVDAHAHLTASEFDEDRESILENLPEKKLDIVVTVGENPEHSLKAMELANSYSSVYCTVGFHPHYAKDFKDSLLKEYREWLKLPKVKALGEIGLDYYYEHSPRKIQIQVFEKFLELALSEKKPFIIHTRQSYNDLLSLLKTSGHSEFNGVIHCFDEDKSVAKQFLDLDFFISFSGLVTFKKALAIQKAAEYVPLEKMLMETDCPYLSPEPIRGKRNQPAFVEHTAKKLAALKQIPVQELCLQIKKNTYKFYEIENNQEIF